MHVNKSTGLLRKAAYAAAAGLLAFACISALSGCKTSDTLTELFFDQNAEQVDEDNASKLLHNTLDALELTENLPELQRNDQSELERERTEENPVRGDEDSQEQASIAEQNDHASSKSETNATGTSTLAANSGDGGESGGSGSSGNSNSKGSAKKRSKGGNGNSGAGDGTVYKGDGGSGTVYNENGSYTELPEGVQTVVAFGECANMVVSFAGEHALMGADAGFLGNSFIKKAYKADDISNAKTISTSKKGVIDASRVAELGPDAVLLLNNAGYSVDEDGLATLKAANVDVVYLPALNSATHITYVAKAIGSMFGGSSDTLSGDDAQAAASEYISWHNEIVSSLVGKHGGLAGTMDFDSGSTDGDFVSGTYTAYVSQWDNATYKATPDNKTAWTDTAGVAISKCGYKWSPMSYYLSVGGTVNVSATFKEPFYDTTASYYIWQFNLGRVPAVYKANWTNRSISVSKLSNSGTSDLLVKAEDGTTLGSSSYSYLVADTQAIAQAMEKSSTQGTKKQQGLYAVYKSVKGEDGSGTGFLSKTGNYCSAAISGVFTVEVNPHGLYSSWVAGSPESVLEAVWADDLNSGGSTLNSKIKEYYKMFYGVELTSKQLKTINAGLKA